MNYAHLGIEERCCLRKYYNEGNKNCKSVALNLTIHSLAANGRALRDVDMKNVRDHAIGAADVCRSVPAVALRFCGAAFDCLSAVTSSARSACP